MSLFDDLDLGAGDYDKEKDPGLNQFTSKPIQRQYQPFGGQMPQNVQSPVVQNPVQYEQPQPQPQPYQNFNDYDLDAYEQAKKQYTYISQDASAHSASAKLYEDRYDDFVKTKFKPYYQSLGGFDGDFETDDEYANAIEDMYKGDLTLSQSEDGFFGESDEKKAARERLKGFTQWNSPNGLRDQFQRLKKEKEMRRAMADRSNAQKSALMDQMTMLPRMQLDDALKARKAASSSKPRSRKATNEMLDQMQFENPGMVNPETGLRSNLYQTDPRNKIKGMVNPETGKRSKDFYAQQDRMAAAMRGDVAGFMTRRESVSKDRQMRDRGILFSQNGMLDGYPVGLSRADADILDIEKAKKMGIKEYKGRPIEEAFNELGGEERLNVAKIMNAVRSAYSNREKAQIDWLAANRKEELKAPMEEANESFEKALQLAAQFGLTDEIVEQTESKGFFSRMAESMKNAFRRGLKMNEMSKYADDFFFNAADQSEIEKFIEAAEELGEIPASSAAKKFQNYKSKGLWDSISNLLFDNTEAIPELFVESMSSFLPAYVRTGMYTIPGAAAAGGVAGLAGGPVAPVTVTGGALSGAGIAARLNWGTASMVLEYSGMVLQGMQELNIDWQNPKVFAAAWNNQITRDAIKEKALKKGLPIALLDAFSGMMAGKVSAALHHGGNAIKGGKLIDGAAWARSKKTYPKFTNFQRARNIGLEIGADATAGMGGEFLGQAWSKEPGEAWDTNAIAAEGIIGLGPGLLGGAYEFAAKPNVSFEGTPFDYEGVANTQTGQTGTVNLAGFRNQFHSFNDARPAAAHVLNEGNYANAEAKDNATRVLTDIMGRLYAINPEAMKDLKIVVADRTPYADKEMEGSYHFDNETQTSVIYINRNKIGQDPLGVFLHEAGHLARHLMMDKAELISKYDSIGTDAQNDAFAQYTLKIPEIKYSQLDDAQKAQVDKAKNSKGMSKLRMAEEWFSYQFANLLAGHKVDPSVKTEYQNFLTKVIHPAMEKFIGGETTGGSKKDKFEFDQMILRKMGFNPDGTPKDGLKFGQYYQERAGMAERFFGNEMPIQQMGDEEALNHLMRKVAVIAQTEGEARAKQVAEATNKILGKKILPTEMSAYTNLELQEAITPLGEAQIDAQDAVATAEVLETLEGEDAKAGANKLVEEVEVEGDTSANVTETARLKQTLEQAELELQTAQNEFESAKRAGQSKEQKSAGKRVVRAKQTIKGAKAAIEKAKNLPPKAKGRKVKVARVQKDIDKAVDQTAKEINETQALMPGAEVTQKGDKFELRTRQPGTRKAGSAKTFDTKEAAEKAKEDFYKAELKKLKDTSQAVTNLKKLVLNEKEFEKEAAKVKAKLLKELNKNKADVIPEITPDDPEFIRLSKLEEKAREEFRAKNEEWQDGKITDQELDDARDRLAEAEKVTLDYVLEKRNKPKPKAASTASTTLTEEDITFGQIIAEMMDLNGLQANAIFSSALAGDRLSELGSMKAPDGQRVVQIFEEYEQKVESASFLIGQRIVDLEKRKEAILNPEALGSAQAKNYKYTHKIVVVVNRYGNKIQYREWDGKKFGPKKEAERSAKGAKGKKEGDFIQPYNAKSHRYLSKEYAKAKAVAAKEKGIDPKYIQYKQNKAEGSAPAKKAAAKPAAKAEPEKSEKKELTKEQKAELTEINKKITMLKQYLDAIQPEKAAIDWKDTPHMTYHKYIGPKEKMSFKEENFERYTLGELASTQREDDTIWQKIWNKKRNRHEFVQVKGVSDTQDYLFKYTNWRKHLPDENKKEDITVETVEGSIEPSKKMAMNFTSPKNGKKRDGVEGNSTMDWIRNGSRTATTRTKSQVSGIKVGDVIAFTDGKETLNVRVTKAPYPVEEVTAEEWSKLESWDASKYEDQKGKYQFQYALIKAETPKAAPEARENAVDAEIVEDTPAETTETEDTAVDPITAISEKALIQDRSEISKYEGKKQKAKGGMSSGEALDILIASGTDLEKALAARLKNITKIKSVRVGYIDDSNSKDRGTYFYKKDADVGGVALYPGSVGLTLLHELMHAVTVPDSTNYKRQNREAVFSDKNMQTLYNTWRKARKGWMSDKSIRPKQDSFGNPISEKQVPNYLTRFDEFLAMLYTDKELQSFLTKVKSDTDNNKSLFTEILDAISNILNFDAKGRTLLEESLRAMDSFMESKSDTAQSPTALGSGLANPDQSQAFNPFINGRKLTDKLEWFGNKTVQEYIDLLDAVRASAAMPENVGERAIGKAVKSKGKEVGQKDRIYFQPQKGTTVAAMMLFRLKEMDRKSGVNSRQLINGNLDRVTLSEMTVYELATGRALEILDDREFSGYKQQRYHQVIERKASEMAKDIEAYEKLLAETDDPKEKAGIEKALSDLKRQLKGLIFDYDEIGAFQGEETGGAFAKIHAGSMKWTEILTEFMFYREKADAVQTILDIWEEDIANDQGPGMGRKPKERRNAPEQGAIDSWLVYQALKRTPGVTQKDIEASLAEFRKKAEEAKGKFEETYAEKAAEEETQAAKAWGTETVAPDDYVFFGPGEKATSKVKETSAHGSFARGAVDEGIPVLAMFGKGRVDNFKPEKTTFGTGSGSEQANIGLAADLDRKVNEQIQKKLRNLLKRKESQNIDAFEITKPDGKTAKVKRVNGSWKKGNNHKLPKDLQKIAEDTYINSRIDVIDSVNKDIENMDADAIAGVSSGAHVSAVQLVEFLLSQVKKKGFGKDALKNVIKSLEYNPSSQTSDGIVKQLPGGPAGGLLPYVWFDFITALHKKLKIKTELKLTKASDPAKSGWTNIADEMIRTVIGENGKQTRILEKNDLYKDGIPDMDVMVEMVKPIIQAVYNSGRLRLNPGRGFDEKESTANSANAANVLQRDPMLHDNPLDAVLGYEEAPEGSFDNMEVDSVTNKDQAKQTADDFEESVEGNFNPSLDETPSGLIGGVVWLEKKGAMFPLSVKTIDAKNHPLKKGDILAGINVKGDDKKQSSLLKGTFEDAITALNKFLKGKRGVDVNLIVIPKGKQAAESRPYSLGSSYSLSSGIPDNYGKLSILSRLASKAGVSEEDKEKFKKVFKNFDFKTSLVDQADPPKQMVANFLKSVGIKDQALIDAIDVHGKWHQYYGKGYNTVEQSQIRFIEPIKDAMAKHGVTNAMLGEYLLARAAPSRNMHLKEMYEAELKTLEEDSKEYKSLKKMLDERGDSLSGINTKDAIDRIKEMEAMDPIKNFILDENNPLQLFYDMNKEALKLKSNSGLIRDGVDIKEAKAMVLAMSKYNINNISRARMKDNYNYAPMQGFEGETEKLFDNEMAYEAVGKSSTAAGRGWDQPKHAFLQNGAFGRTNTNIGPDPETVFAAAQSQYFDAAIRSHKNEVSNAFGTVYEFMRAIAYPDDSTGLPNIELPDELKNLSPDIKKKVKAEFDQIFEKEFRELDTKKDYEIQEKDIEIDGKKVDGLKMVRRTLSTKFQNDPYVFVYRKEGVPHFIKFKGEPGARMAASLKNLRYESLPRILQLINKMTRFMAQMFTSMNPAFIIPNFIRDVGTAAIHLSEDDKKNMVGKTLSGKRLGKFMKAIFKVEQSLSKGENIRVDVEIDEDNAMQLLREGDHQKMYQFAKQAGAKIGMFRHKSMPELIEDARTNKAKNKKGVKARLKTVTQLVESMNTAVENSIRMSAFWSAIETGRTVHQAASISRNVTVDFNQKGNLTQAFGSLFVFFGASTNSAHRFARTLHKRGKVGSGKLIGGILAASFLVALFNRLIDDDEDEEMPDYDTITSFKRDTNLLLPLPGNIPGLEDKTGRDTGYFGIPVPLGYNVFWALGQTTADFFAKYFMDRGGSGAMDFFTRNMDATMNAFNPIGGASLATALVPSAGKPIVEMYANKNFMGTEIRKSDVPYEAPKPAHMMDQKRTQELWTDFSRFINKALGGNDEIKGSIGGLFGGNPLLASDDSDYKFDLSGSEMEHLALGYLGGPGQIINMLIGDGLYPMIDDKEYNFDINKMPVVNRFVRTTTYGSATRRSYYKIREAAMIAKKAVEAAQKRGGAEYATMQKNQKPLIDIMPQIKAMDGKRSKIRDMKNKIENNKSFTNSQKMQRIEELERKELNMLTAVIKKAQSLGIS